MPGILRNTFIAALALLASACGFQLRGAVDIPPEWLTLHLESASPNSELSDATRNGFTANGVTWADRGDANYVLILGPEKFSRRDLTIGNNARASEFELIMSTSLRVTDRAGKELMPSSDVAVHKIMTSNLNNITGKVEEARLLQREMRVDLVQQLMRKVRFLASSGST